VLPRISVDFNTMGRGKGGRVLINLSAPSNRDRVPPECLQPGARVLVYEGEETDVLEVEATLELDEEYQDWWAIPHWFTRRDY